MESLLVEQSLSPRKQIKNPKRKTPHFIHHPTLIHQQVSRFPPNISRQSSLNYAPQQPPPLSAQEYDHMMMIMHGGMLLNNQYPTSYPPAVSSSPSPILLQKQMNQHNNMHHAPAYNRLPLLPLPSEHRPAFRSLPTALRRSHSLSPPVTKKPTTKTKTTPNTLKPKKDDNNYKKKPVCVPPKGNGKEVNVEADGAKETIGSDPSTPPKDEITRVLFTDLGSVVDKELFSGCIYSMAPPPSSLPLPKFSLRKPKLSCNAEAAIAAATKVDTSATDSLCRMLRLQ